MLTLDIASLMESREIQNPLRTLVKAGFNYHSANKILKQQVVRMDIKHIEQICLLLNCTPDDLFTWKPDKNTKNTGKIALQKLSGRQRKGSILPKIKSLPQHKLDELRKYVEQLSDE